MQRCINIDWLEVYVLESEAETPCDAAYFEDKGFVVHRRDYGTRVYREMFVIEDEHGFPWLEVRRNPYSTQGHNRGFFPPTSSHVRLSNYACYDDSAVNKLRQFLARFDYKFVKIFRLDICMDFVKFDRGDDPNRFLQRFLRGKYSKINQANISAHGTDQWNGRYWQSVSWGNPKSMVSTKLYCKTKELQQVKDKPYIRWAWFQSGLVDNPVGCTVANVNGIQEPVDVWRVEFSIKSSANRWYPINHADDSTRNISLPHGLSMYDSREKLVTVFASLARHYFRFKKFKRNVRKDRCPDKVLFVFSTVDTVYKIDRLASHAANAKPEERLVIKLKMLKLVHGEAEVVTAIDLLLDYLERDIIRKYSDPMLADLDIKTLQRLIAERSRGIRQASIKQQFDDIRKLILDVPDFF